MLITVSDLPGSGWRELGAGAWRAGVGESGEAAHRARKTGEFTAKRTFRNDESEFGVMVQILPLANSADAELQVRRPPLESEGVRWKGVTTIESQVVKDLEVPGADHFIAWENLNERDGRRGYSRKIKAQVGRLVSYVQCSKMGDGCEWSTAVEVATAQVAKLQAFRDTRPE
jgi:hypothetical protein